MVPSTRLIRWVLPLPLFAYLALRYIFPDLDLVTELILYNLIPLSALTATLASPRFNNRASTVTLSVAISVWWIGSLASSYSQYIEPIPAADLYIDALYLAFYPFLLISLQQINQSRKPLGVAGAIDLLALTVIISLVLILLIAARDGEVLSIFGYQDSIFAAYLLFDAILIVWVAKIITLERVNTRNLSITIGVSLFVLTDLLFIWSTSSNSYLAGEALDSGWIAGISFIAFAIWCEEEKSENEKTIHPFTLIASLLISIVLLTLLALGDDQTPALLVAPAFLSLLLAIVRISTVLQKTHQLSDESYLAHIDELTGLANRRKIIAELSTFNKGEGAFLLLDLNGFKPINDQYGHGTGDQLLREIGERFTRALPASALVARLGGDEFGIIIKGSYEESLEGAYALRASLSYPFTISGQKISVGVSIGYVHNDGRGDLLKRADVAMYQAKHSDEGLVQS